MDADFENEKSVFVRALSILKREWMQELNQGFEEAPVHEFSPAFEERMSALLNQYGSRSGE